MKSDCKVVMITNETKKIPVHNISNTLPLVLSKEMGLKLEIINGSSFLKIGVTFASFQMFGTSPLLKEKLKRLQRGKDNRKSNSLRI